MKFNIISEPSYSLAEIKLNDGESIVVEPGAMAWMDTTIKPKTEMKGGFFAGIKRKFAGESFFLNTYSAEGGSGTIGIAPGYSGDIIVKELNNERKTKSFLVIKNDSILFEKYYDGHKQSDISNTFSVSKSIVVSMMGKAIMDGKIKSLEQPVSDFFE